MSADAAGLGKNLSPGQGIKVHQVSHVYGGGDRVVQALKEVNLDIEVGSFVSLVGASGCGKTTLLDIMCGLTEGQQGTVTVGGLPPKAGRPDTARMFARDALLPWLTAEQNVDYALKTRIADVAARRRRIAALLSAVGLGDFAHAYPRQLSQGMRQRVALVRTFSLHSEFVFLDEPFGALDALTKITLQEELIRLWSETKSTVVLVTHDLSEAAALSDRVVVMSPRPGRIVADVRIDIPRPRRVRDLHANPEFHEIVADLWARLE